MDQHSAPVAAPDFESFHATTHDLIEKMEQFQSAKKELHKFFNGLDNESGEKFIHSSKKQKLNNDEIHE